MKSWFSIAAATAALSASSVDAKKHYTVKEDITQKEHKRPMVEESTEKCAVDSVSFRVCGTYGANAKIGWEWQQQFYTLTERDKYYELRWDLYANQSVDLEGLFYADRIYSNDTSITLDDFKVLFTIQMKHWYYNGRTCIAIFYAIDDLVFEIQMRQRFLEGNKNIVEHLWTFDNWISPYALWLDEIGLSDYTPIKVYRKEIQQADSQKVIFGTVEDEAENCKPGYVFLNIGNNFTGGDIGPFDRWANQKMENFFDYLRENYPDTLASGILW